MGRCSVRGILLELLLLDLEGAHRAHVSWNGLAGWVREWTRQAGVVRRHVWTLYCGRVPVSEGEQDGRNETEEMTACTEN